MPTATVVSHGARLEPRGLRPGADSGEPQVSSRLVDGLGRNAAGVWESEPGGWPVVDRADTEVAYILSGAAVVTDAETSETHQLGPGDLIVLPTGWSGRWDVTQTLRKVFVTYH